MNLRRTGEIAMVLINHGFADVVEGLQLRSYLRWGREVLTRQTLTPDEPVTRPVRIRKVLESLGPTFIKFGQVASTRPDLLPPDVIEELTLLQESVPPFDSDQAIQVVETDLGRPINELFLSFDTKPWAAGSLAQVHKAVHHDGTPLAIKIRRPNAVRDVERDLVLMMDIASLINNHIPEARIFDPEGLVNHFSRSVKRELNLQREQRTIQDFNRLFEKDSTLHVPVVYPDLCCESVLTMEYIQGLRPDQVTPETNLFKFRNEIADNGARIFLKQVFEFGIFHGDPHPGNMRILADGSICLLDYGMIGMIDEDTRDQLIDFLVALTSQDISEIIRILLKLGQTTKTVDRHLLELDLRDFLASYYNIPLAQLQTRKMVTDFLTILSIHQIRCPGDLMLLIRAVIHLESCGRALDPEFNLVNTLYPFVRRNLQLRYMPQRFLRRTLSDIQQLAHTVKEIPLQTNQLLNRMNEGNLKLELEHKNLEHLVTEIDRSSNRIVIGVIVSSLILASSLIIRTDGAQSWISIPVYVLSSLLGAWLIYGIFRSGQL
jgi:ubiquinone biosynthesis protein